MLGAGLDLIIDPLARKIGIYYPPILAFILVMFTIVIALLYFSIITSELKSKIKELTQKIVLLEYDLKEMRER